MVPQRCTPNNPIPGIFCCLVARDAVYRYITSGSLTSPLQKEVLLPSVTFQNHDSLAITSPFYRTTGPLTISGARGCRSCTSSRLCWWSTP
jgi:hypothetical protein